MAELRSSFVHCWLFFGCPLVSRECSLVLSVTDLEVSPMFIVVQSWHESFSKSLTWVSDFSSVFVEVSATRIPS